MQIILNSSEIVERYATTKHSISIEGRDFVLFIFETFSNPPEYYFEGDKVELTSQILPELLTNFRLKDLLQRLQLD